MAFVVISAVVILGIIGVSMVSSRQREHRLEGYTGLSREAFIEHFSAQGVPANVSATVYDTYKRKVRSPKFMPSPEMSIEDTFEQMGEDTDDDAHSILETLRIPEPTRDALERLNVNEVRSLADLVLWIDKVRREAVT